MPLPRKAGWILSSISRTTVSCCRKKIGSWKRKKKDTSSLSKLIECTTTTESECNHSMNSLRPVRKTSTTRLLLWDFSTITSSHRWQWNKNCTRSFLTSAKKRSVSRRRNWPSWFSSWKNSSRVKRRKLSMVSFTSTLSISASRKMSASTKRTTNHSRTKLSKPWILNSSI